MTERALKKETTSHPYIVINENVCDGSPIIAGTRTRVIDIAIEYEALGRSPDEIVGSHPHVSLYHIHDALSYYYENRDEKATIFTHDNDILRIAVEWIDDERIHWGVVYCHQNAYGIGDCIRNFKILVTVLTQEDMTHHIEFL